VGLLYDERMCARARRLTGRTTRETPTDYAPSGASSTLRASRPGTGSLPRPESRAIGLLDMFAYVWPTLLLLALPISI
jgi:hypothetical protein